MKQNLALSALALAFTVGTAYAQAPSADAPIEPVPQPEPQPEQPPTPPTPPRPPTVVVAPTVAAEAPTRPAGFSIGIGVGYRFPTSLQTPNTTTVRFRLPNAITLEPTLVLASSTQETDVGMTDSRSTIQVGAGVLARFPIVTRHKTDLEFLGAINVDRLNQDPNDQTTDDDTTITTTTIGYGLSVGYWVKSYLNVSLSATNALVAYTHVREAQSFDFVTVTNTTTFGLIWDPTVALMVHLYN